MSINTLGKIVVVGFTELFTFHFHCGADVW